MLFWCSLKSCRLSQYSQNLFQFQKRQRVSFVPQVGNSIKVNVLAAQKYKPVLKPDWISSSEATASPHWLHCSSLTCDSSSDPCVILNTQQRDEQQWDKFGWLMIYQGRHEWAASSSKGVKPEGLKGSWLRQKAADLMTVHVSQATSVDLASVRGFVFSNSCLCDPEHHSSIIIFIFS